MFPVADSGLKVTDGRILDYHEGTAVISNTVDSALKIMSASKSQILPSSEDPPFRKKCKIRRIVGQSKFEKKVATEKAEGNDSTTIKRARLNSFCEKYNDNTELDNKINDSLLDILQAKTGVHQMPLTDYCRYSRLNYFRTQNRHRSRINVIITTTTI